MTTSINGTYAAQRSASRRPGAPIAVDYFRRTLANLAHVYKRVTGSDITGFATNSVAGHGHGGDGDGEPMLATLGVSTAATSIIGETATDDGSQGYMAPAAEPLFSIYPGTDVTGELRLPPVRAPGDSLPLGSVPHIPPSPGGFTGDEGLWRIAPMWRRVFVPPGCRHVGCRIVASPLELFDGGSRGTWSLRLTSAESADITGDVDGTTGNTYAATETGGEVQLENLPSGSPWLLEYDAGEQKFRIADAAAIPTVEAWLGKPARPTPTDEDQTALVDDRLEPISGQLTGAVAVTPGAFNDIDIEFRVAGVRPVLMVWSLHLFALP